MGVFKNADLEKNCYAKTQASAHQRGACHVGVWEY